MIKIKPHKRINIKRMPALTKKEKEDRAFEANELKKENAFCRFVAHKEPRKIIEDRFITKNILIMRKDREIERLRRENKSLEAALSHALEQGAYRA